MKQPRRLPLDEVRTALQATLHDCRDMRAQRIVYKINVAKTGADLWLLRSDLYQCISQTHNQAEAVKRINGLLTVFEGWVPARSLTRI
ncbi:MAG: hypothetical protein EON92_13285 [Burkholderiales bacterium]|nr:MAG: hypothetical protein EON92_13285 [Burkholderiales bacterium]